MAEQPPNVRLNLASTPENVVLVREMLSGVAEAVRLDGGDLNDIRTAVTEACNNVVLHAYEDETGPMDVEVCIGEDALRVLVRDHGNGIKARDDIADRTPPGIGVHVIQTLTNTVEFKDGPDGGTEVRMEFTPSTGTLEPFPKDGLPAPTLVEPFPKDGLPPPTLALADSPTTATVSIAPISLARTVLPRMVSALAARAHFSTDRISDAQLLADALVAHAHGAMSGDHLSIDVNVEPRELELRIAPLGAGRGQRLIGDSELDGLGRVIEKLTDRCGVATDGSYETLTLGLVDRR
jgi:anti-sigma regulatory factor (Ser/Thr protein kinase)